VDIVSWLKDLGLARYAEAFRDNDIDARILPSLSAEDLKELGVTSLGHRKKLLEAIAALQEPAVARADTSTPAMPREAERRQLTVMFVDLVGSTTLTARLDPEDMGQVIRAYQGCCTEVVERWGGHVAKYMGDGVLAYFGWPQAHEDEAERAVRAGLALAEAVGRLASPTGAPLAARVGIATGLVMVGELVGEGAAKEQTVVGETPNLAARLQVLAAPGKVVISQATRRLLGGLFELAELGPLRLKGFAGPLAAWRVEGEGRAEDRFVALHGAHLTPLVGRKHELNILLERWAWAKDGDGQVVLLWGEPGIGKSRITQTLRERLADEPHVRLRYFCSPYHINSALHPVLDQLGRAAGFVANEAAEAKLAKLAMILGDHAPDVAEAVALLAPLSSIPSGERYPALDLSPQRQKRRTLEVLAEQLEGLAARQPVLMILEDAQWVDPTTLELFDLIVESIGRLRVLLLVTFRPEFNPPWTGHAHVTQLSLNRLSHRQASAMVERLSGGRALPAEVVEQIVSRTDGVPLFVEELTKMVLESGLLTDAGDHYELSGPLPPLAIPATLHDSLTARLDRLAPVKEVAQIGAVIGREFPHELIAAVSPLSAADLTAALDQLLQSELIFRRGTPPDAAYSFKHALVQDTAYQSLLKARRQTLHAKVAGLMQQPEKAEYEPELVAHHLTQAGDAERAIGYWRRAAQRASERSAHREAVAHLRQAIELLRQLPETQARDRLELQLQISLGAALIVLYGYSPPMAEGVYERARDLAQKLAERAQLFTVTWGLWMINQTRGQVTKGRPLADELLALAEENEDVGQRLEAHHAAWTTLLFVPDLVTCRGHTEQGLALYDRDRHIEHKFLYGGHDPGVCGLIHRALAEWLLGFPDQALESVRQALDLASSLDHGPTLAIALSTNSHVHRCRGETAIAGRCSEELIRLCCEQGIFPQFQAYGRTGLGWAMARAGDLDGAIVEMRGGLEQAQATGVQLRRAYHLALFAEVCVRAGLTDEAREVLAAALRSAERWWEPEVHRLLGELHLAEAAGVSGAKREGERCFQRALRLARSQQARSLELRAATNLARLWRDQGKRAEARNLLAPVYGWFTEGFDTADLEDARALLDELA